MRAVGWSLVLGLLVIGWGFIIWQNKFHVTAPLVFVCLGFLAAIATIVNMWRIGAAIVAPGAAGEEAWARPIGARGELDKEKRTLLKAIKEAEFDHEMGKLSKADADAMIQMYRARAIAVIKELDQLDGADGDLRAKIEREIKARQEVAAQKPKKKPKKKAKAEADKAEDKAEAEKEEAS